jgi:hypothetical protein
MDYPVYKETLLVFTFKIYFFITECTILVQ